VIDMTKACRIPALAPIRVPLGQHFWTLFSWSMWWSHCEISCTPLE
jgi:hypothetical protein